MDASRCVCTLWERAMAQSGKHAIHIDSALIQARPSIPRPHTPTAARLFYIRAPSASSDAEEPTPWPACTRLPVNHLCLCRMMVTARDGQPSARRRQRPSNIISSKASQSFGNQTLPVVMVEHLFRSLLRLTFRTLGHGTRERYGCQGRRRGRLCKEKDIALVLETRWYQSVAIAAASMDG